MSDVAMPAPLKNDRESLKQAIQDRLIHGVGKDPAGATDKDWLNATIAAIRERVVERRLSTMRHFREEQVKRVYYLSMEFLLGRLFANALVNLDLYDTTVQALEELGVDFHKIAELEPDAALGNGGLGRLAACILDSLVTQCYPGYGYGIRYEYGMFRQELREGCQVEHPDNWLRYGNDWEFPRQDLIFKVGFYGHVVQHSGEGNEPVCHWEGRQEVIAMAFDYMIPGYGAQNVNNLRLWSAKSTRDFDLNYFNEGDYVRAVEMKNEGENISRVLYPNDATAFGRELRLRQEYFFVCASLQDILKRHFDSGHKLAELPDKVSIQLNDTHPAIAVPELMRMLVDEYRLPWQQAWDLTQRTFSYTNHTLMPEALETWPVELLEHVLPRHLQIIFRINEEFLKDVRHRYPGDNELARRVSLIDEDNGRRVRMAYLALVGSHRVNGVAELHTSLLKQDLFADFERLFPGKLTNVTNGITPRLWLHQSNRGLSQLITDYIGDGWISHLDKLKALEQYAGDSEFQRKFMEVKTANKRRLMRLVEERTGIRLDPQALFDVQIKRIHEYKRQMLNLLHTIMLYNRIRDGRADNRVPRAVLFAGKAAPGYEMAKRIICLTNDVADVINNDPQTKDHLKLVFFPNYEVSSAAVIIPAADLSQQISTAGKEASGTGNMKLSLNGALTIGTMDGANIEIREEVGEDNIFIFGLHADQVADLRARGYRPRDYYERNEELRRAVDMIADGFFSPEQRDRHMPVVDNLLGIDPFLVLADFDSYVTAQEHVDELYRDQPEWIRKTILNTARMGKFSIDRTVSEYAEKIWGVTAESSA